MDILQFDTAVLPPEQRLAAFQSGATDFEVEAVGDPASFTTCWRLLKLGDVNAIRASISPVLYRRDMNRIAADGEDRVAIHVYERGSSAGVNDGRPVAVHVGGAMVWDLARPIELRSTEPVEVSILTVPRYLLDEVLPVASPAGVIEPCPELTLALRQIHYLFDHAAELPEEGAAFYGRALRSLFAAAMLPRRDVDAAALDDTAPLLQRISALLDEEPSRTTSEQHIAERLGVPLAQVVETVARFGGLDQLVERRRLLAAYRLLSDPAEAAPVNVIARRCGFSDVTRFSRRFRSVFQLSASEMRRRRHGRLPRWAGAYDIEQHYAPLRAS